MSPPVAEQLSRTIETLYRSESGRILATLVRLLGDLDLAEKSMHEAFASAGYFRRFPIPASELTLRISSVIELWVRAERSASTSSSYRELRRVSPDSRFGHAKVPGWMARPALFPVVCLLTATTGTLAVHGFKTTMVGVAVTTFVSIGILRIFEVHMPPALAVGLLPFVMVAPNAWYPISVALGTIALTVCAVGYTYRRTVMRDRKTAGASLNP